MLAGEKLQAPAFDGFEHAHIWEAIGDRSGYCGCRGGIGVRQPLLQYAAFRETPPHKLIEIARVEKTGCGRADRRGRVDHDEVVGLSDTAEKPTSIVDMNMRSRGRHHRYSVCMEEAEQRNHARNQFDDVDIRVPGHRRTERSPHPKANDKNIARRLGASGERQMHHHFGVCR